MKFIFDAMLGSLAKRARLMGLDALYMRDEEDREIVILAKETDRWVVTRDTQLAKRTSPHSFLLETTDVEEGWNILVDWMKDKDVPFKPGSRCSVCNTPLIEVDIEDVKDKVPSGVLERRLDTWLCKGCGRVYWKGSHWDRIMEHVPE